MIKRKAKRVAPKPEPLKKMQITQQGFGCEMPPELGLVEIYFDQKDLAAQALPFYKHYEDLNWQSQRRIPFKNWKSLAADWIYNYLQEIKLKHRLQINRYIF